MSYTNAPAPTTVTWSDLAPTGLTTYDENTVTYDSPITLYDGTTAFTNGPAPTTATFTNAPAPTTP